MAEIKKGDCTYTDTLDKIHETDKGLECCGGNMQLIMHLDCEDCCESRYQCECGNIISVRLKRKALW